MSTTNRGYGSPLDWIIDSASTAHICTNKDLFDELTYEAYTPIQSGSLNDVKVEGRSTVRIIADIGDDNTHALMLRNVYYVLTYTANLILLNLIAKVAKINISGKTLTAKIGDNIIFKGTTTARMLTFLDQPQHVFATLTSSPSVEDTWHNWLGHPGAA